MSKEVNQKIIDVVSDIKKDIELLKSPELKIPLRSLSNVAYDDKDGYFRLNRILKNRTLTAATSRSFAQTLRMMQLSKSLLDTNDIATKREAYYTAYNWEEARFNNQPESDTVMDDVEAMLYVNREQLGFIPEERGGDVAGDLVVIDRDPDTKEKIRVDCKKMGSGAYSIPSSVEHLEFETTAKFVLAVETGGAFQRLVKHKYWDKAKCILVSMGGVPTRACRRFIRRLSDSKKLPVYVFTDGDFYGYMNIYRTLKVGSGNAAHINEFFCVPVARFIGVTPQDIVDYKLPTHNLKEVDIKRGKDAIKNDPFVKHHKEWQQAIKMQIDMGKRAEQQAFAKYDLNFVMTKYLPDKINNPKSWLP
ncbi:MAG TPA: DNA topoisomerase IV subunit A [Candidatus Woesearchaeota archaeon]|nr:DNA topoisomerase IV subunit A [Candidatus Woesearchaeota archaeon]